ncbi:unnamed protein product [Moneuplotes crassus]|uniref:Uncharacterized protein n=1 Tax=Euplotes crassus TaxID=5936 RepID=A0AAD1X9H1_EUPCR|nr:unnamed protein product [Moneuplotes crassus]
MDQQWKSDRQKKTTRDTSGASEDILSSILSQLQYPISKPTSKYGLRLATSNYKIQHKTHKLTKMLKVGIGERGEGGEKEGFEQRMEMNGTIEEYHKIGVETVVDEQVPSESSSHEEEQEQEEDKSNEETESEKESLEQEKEKEKPLERRKRKVEYVKFEVQRDTPMGKCVSRDRLVEMNAPKVYSPPVGYYSPNFIGKNRAVKIYPDRSQVKKIEQNFEDSQDFRKTCNRFLQKQSLFNIQTGTIKKTSFRTTRKIKFDKSLTKTSNKSLSRLHKSTHETILRRKSLDNLKNKNSQIHSQRFHRSSQGGIDFKRMLQRPSFIQNSETPHPERFSTSQIIPLSSSKYKSPKNTIMHKLLGTSSYSNDRYSPLHRPARLRSTLLKRLLVPEEPFCKVQS